MSTNPHDELLTKIAEAIGERPVGLTPLHGGCVARVYKAEFENRPPVAVKHETGSEPGSEPGLAVEGFMLEHLAANTALPLPGVVHAEPTLLVLEFIEHDGARSARGEAELADLMADLHERPTKETTFGLERDTRIGPLVQPNGETESWSDFYRDQRLLAFGRLARDRGVISSETHDGVRRLADSLERLLAPTADDPPALLHGDLWAGNILWDRGRPRALIDPACHRGHPEVELAFIDLMGGLSGAFWDRYRGLRPLAAGWQERRRVYQLYPLLVHAALFDRGVGGGYGQSVSATLRELGV